MVFFFVYTKRRLTMSFDYLHISSTAFFLRRSGFMMLLGSKRLFFSSLVRPFIHRSFYAHISIIIRNSCTISVANCAVNRLINTSDDPLGDALMFSAHVSIVHCSRSRLTVVVRASQLIYWFLMCVIKR